MEGRLTKKEKEILDLILADKSNKEIAATLFIELSTVKTHINKIYSKLEVKSRKELFEKA
jgi:DNA-binding CsgD family transcriptional regulator